MVFKEKYSKFFEKIGRSKFMVLSTSKDDFVTSRMVSIIVIDGKFYFQMDKNFKKYNQIIVNPNVSLCIDNIQINGICCDVGRPIENKTFCEIFKEKYPSSYKNYSLLESERLLEIEPIYIECWHYIEGVSYIEVFDVKNKKYTMKKYVR